MISHPMLRRAHGANKGCLLLSRSRSLPVPTSRYQVLEEKESLHAAGPRRAPIDFSREGWCLKLIPSSTEHLNGQTGLSVG